MPSTAPALSSEKVGPPWLEEVGLPWMEVSPPWLEEVGPPALDGGSHPCVPSGGTMVVTPGTVA
jgi:hypothetical protein